MSYRTFLMIILLVASLGATGRAYTTILGNIQGSSVNRIRLYTWSDQVTYMNKKLAAGTINEEGDFNLIVELAATTQAFFYIGNIRADIILEPGKSYEIQFDQYPPISYLETRNMILQRETLGYTIINQPEDEINKIMGQASAMYNQFLADHYMDLYYKRYPVIDAFIDTFFLRFGHYTEPFIRQMVDYRIANLKLAGYKINLREAHSLWLRNVDLLYDHPDFMEFFNQIFSNYLTTRQKNYNYNDLLTAINDRGSYFALSDMLGRDTVLRNEQLRELVMIKGLAEIYNHRDFDQEQVARIVNHIANSSKFPEHRTIARNLLFLNKRFSTGMAAPDFSLPDRNGMLHSISNYQGKYLYIVFFTSNCVPCLSELRYLQTIYPELKEDMEVLGIGLDPDSAKLWEMIEQQPLPWPVVHFNNDFELTDRFNIRSYPFFMLIRPDGTFESYGVRPPSNRFKLWFDEVVMNRR